MQRKRGLSCGPVAGVAAAALVIAFIVSLFFWTKVDAGTACVVTRGGKVTEVATPGYNFKTPLEQYHCYNTRLQSYETVVDQRPDQDGLQTDSQATFKDYRVLGKSNEGIDYEATYIIQYHTPPESALDLYKSKARSDEAVKEQIVKLHSRALVPQILNTHSADTLYLGNLKELSAEIEAALAPRFAEAGIVLDYFELKKPNLADAYEQAITEKALVVEQTKQTVLEHAKAEEEAEVVRIAAQAQADANVIAAQADADAVLIAAQAEAESIEVRGAAIEANPSTLTWEQIQAIRSANVIYLPSDSGVLPIMDINGMVSTGDDENG